MNTIGMYVYTLNGYYIIQGDDVKSWQKKECERRIRQLNKSGLITSTCKNYLLERLKTMKKGTL